jgi:hypothetical protein
LASLYILTAACLKVFMGPFLLFVNPMHGEKLYAK